MNKNPLKHKRRTTIIIIQTKDERNKNKKIEKLNLHVMKERSCVNASHKNQTGYKKEKILSKRIRRSRYDVMFF